MNQWFGASKDFEKTANEFEKQKAINNNEIIIRRKHINSRVFYEYTKKYSKNLAYIKGGSFLKGIDLINESISWFAINAECYRIFSYSSLLTQPSPLTRKISSGGFPEFRILPGGAKCHKNSLHNSYGYAVVQ